MITLSSNDLEIVNTIGELTHTTPKPYSPDLKTSYSWKFYSIKDQKYLTNREYFSEFAAELLTTCDNKRIPTIYKYGSLEQRLRLIQGLLDTDGSILLRRESKRSASIRYTSINLNLILDIQEILFSLGYKSTIVKDKRTEKYSNGTCYNLNISVPNNDKAKLFLLSRKKDQAELEANYPDHKRYDRIPIVNIEPLNQELEMTCLYVDNPEHLYLTNDYIVTHNTSLLEEVLAGNIGNYDLHEIVSYTTREPRQGEIDGLSYHL